MSRALDATICNEPWHGERAAAVAAQGRAGVCRGRVDAGAGAKATVGEGVGKIREGVGFFNRGVRLLGSDVSSAGRLFYRAGAGASLKPREVRSCASAKEHMLLCKRLVAPKQ